MGMLQYANLNSPIEKDIDGIISGTLTAGSQVYVNFSNNPELPDTLETYYLAPSTETDVLFGIYIDSSLTVDGWLKFKVNDIDTNIVFGKLYPTLLTLTNPVNFNHEIVIPPNAKLEVLFVPFSSGTLSSDEYVHLRLMRVPLGYKGTVKLPR